ncbi:MAG: ABC transporter permease [Actinomycetota bacterium]|jgi:simple sugar transport system permease protein/ribose transport system permease protein|nr:ABC transporter permease [Actinomycetota bacterium]
MSKFSKISLWLIENMIWVILLVYVVINIFVTPKFVTYGNITNIFYHSSVLSMLVLAQGLVLLLGYMDLSIESTLAFAPVISVLLLVKYIPWITPVGAIVLTLLLGCLVGAFNGTMITRFGINPFLQTLSLLIILRGIVIFLLPVSIFEFSDVYSAPGALRTIFNIPVAVFIMIFVFIIFHFVLNKTIFGRHLIATGGNNLSAYISGVNTKRVVFITFVISGLLAALAGLIMAGRQQAVTNAMGDGMVFESFAGAILGGVSLKGGVGKVSGMLGGVLLLGAIDNSLNLLGINVFLIYASKGLLIFVAIVLDQAKVKLKNYIYYREDMRRFKETKEIAGV